MALIKRRRLESPAAIAKRICLYGSKAELEIGRRAFAAGIKWERRRAAAETQLVSGPAFHVDVKDLISRVQKLTDGS